MIFFHLTSHRRFDLRRPRRGPTGFTLVEMLTVMGIVALLLAATVPALKGPLGVNARRGAVNNLLGALDQARALAISEGRATYVVFINPKFSTDLGQPAPDPRKVGNAYAIFQDRNNVNFERAQRSPWVTLPVGVAFKTEDANGQAPSVLNRPHAADDPKFSVPTSTGGVQDLYEPFVRFDPTGAADLPAAYAHIYLFEGSVDPQTGAERPTRRATGGTDAATQRAVWDEIQLNYATGRASYNADPTPTP